MKNRKNSKIDDLMMMVLWEVALRIQVGVEKIQVDEEKIQVDEEKKECALAKMEEASEKVLKR